MLSVPYFRRHGPRAEARLLQQADVVAANSAYLADYARQHTPRSATTLARAACWPFTRPKPRTPCPPTWPPCRTPHRGYTGFLTTLRLDLELLLALARKRPDYHLVLVGPEDEDFRPARCTELPNVHFLGNKAPEQLPAYVQHFDVCINPQAGERRDAGQLPAQD